MPLMRLGPGAASSTLPPSDRYRNAEPRRLRRQDEVTAVSFNVYTHLVDKYALLPHGASMGNKYGPILVARWPIVAAENGGSRRGLKIGIPGTLTSASLTLQMFDPDFTSEAIPFDQIQQAVADGRVDAGLLHS